MYWIYTILTGYYAIIKIKLGVLTSKDTHDVLLIFLKGKEYHKEQDSISSLRVGKKWKIMRRGMEKKRERRKP